MVVDKINEMLTKNNIPDLPEELLNSVAEHTKHIFERQFGRKDEGERVIRLSSIGKCLRQQAYNVTGHEKNGKSMDSRSYMVFFMGDVSELAVIYLAKMAGCKIQDEQKEVEVQGVKGHIDATMDGRLVEIKSMSSYGYAEFEKGEVDESYRYQMNAYMLALGYSETIMIALNKDAGVLGEKIIQADNSIQADIVSRITRLKSVVGDELPERPYSPDEKTGYLHWVCRYCNFYKTCWPKSELVLAGKSYKLKVAKDG